MVSAYASAHSEQKSGSTEYGYRLGWLGGNRGAHGGSSYSQSISGEASAQFTPPVCEDDPGIPKSKEEEYTGNSMVGG